MKQFTVAIAGLGARGYQTYAQYQHLHPDRMKITALAEVDADRLQTVAQEFDVPKQRCFASAEELLAQNKLADVLFIATQDRQHIAHALAALEKGYDILLEKPIATTPEDCVAIRDRALQTGRHVVVCHVLRYTEFFNCIKRAIDGGDIGEVVTVQAIENVGFWHQAHSFVRGNWRNSTTTSPMILQKCCHDFDIIGYLIGKRCQSVSSVGSLSFFDRAHAPAGSTERCCDCPHRSTCAYSAYKIYFDNPEIGYRAGNRSWPCNILAEHPTPDALDEAIRTGPYGRCVFRCDNNVVDHQITNLSFEGGVTAQLTMTGFTAYNSREMKVMGTKGEIVADQRKNLVEVRPFGGTATVYDITKLTDDLSGHGGGDNRMLTLLFDTLERGGANPSTVEHSVQSHLMAFAAERSRLRDGERVALEVFDRESKQAAKAPQAMAM